MPEKRCSKCKQRREVEYFAKDRGKPDGRDTWCRSCRSAWRSANKDNEKMRYLRHSTRWREVGAEERAELRVAVGSVSRDMGVEHLTEDLLQEVILARSMNRTSKIKYIVIDSLRKMLGSSRYYSEKDKKKRINLSLGSHSSDNVPIYSLKETNLKESSLFIDPSAFIDSGQHVNTYVQDAVEYTRKTQSSVLRTQSRLISYAAIFELVMMHGFSNREVGKMFCVSDSAISLIIKECLENLGWGQKTLARYDGSG